VDETVRLLFVGADGEKAGMFDRRFENILIDEPKSIARPDASGFTPKGIRTKQTDFMAAPLAPREAWRVGAFVKPAA